MKLGLRPGGEAVEERADVHVPRSYGSARPAILPRAALWRRVGALALDLLLLSGIPLLLTTLLVFVALLFSKGEETALVLVFRGAQALGLFAFLFRDATGASPGKRALALRTIHADGSRSSALDSIVRNLFLLVPPLTLLEAIEVLRRPDRRRLGDRASGTWVAEG